MENTAQQQISFPPHRHILQDKVQRSSEELLSPILLQVRTCALEAMECCVKVPIKANFSTEQLHHEYRRKVAEIWKAVNNKCEEMNTVCILLFGKFQHWGLRAAHPPVRCAQRIQDLQSPEQRTIFHWVVKRGKHAPLGVYNRWDKKEEKWTQLCLAHGHPDSVCAPATRNVKDSSCEMIEQEAFASTLLPHRTHNLNRPVPSCQDWIVPEEIWKFLDYMRTCLWVQTTSQSTINILKEIHSRSKRDILLHFCQRLWLEFVLRHHSIFQDNKPVWIHRELLSNISAINSHEEQCKRRHMHIRSQKKYTKAPVACRSCDLQRNQSHECFHSSAQWYCRQLQKGYHSHATRDWTPMDERT